MSSQYGVQGLTNTNTSKELTDSELEVLSYISLGLRNWEIAELMSVSEETIKDRVKRILWKLDARNRVYAISLAWERGLITTDTLRETRHRFLHSPKKSGLG